MRNGFRFLLLPLVFGAFGAQAQDYPNRPVRLIVPYTPGGQPDNIARALAGPISAALGQSLIIENRPGAGGIPGTQEVMRAAPDGYTLLSADAAQWAIQPALRPGIYDFEKALAPISLIYTSALYIQVRSSVPAKTIQELIALAKSKPGSLSYGSAGNGTVHHLFMETFKSALGLDIVHVPYKGSGQMVQALLAGDIQVGITATASTGPHLKSGAVRLLATTTRERSKLTPEIISQGELGFPDNNFAGESAYFAPAGTPRPIIDKLSGILAKAVVVPDVVQRAETFGVEMLHRNPEQTLQVMRADVARFVKAVKISGAKAE
jgi:tripartite-type tricarboxylate transporter receptor subunit TctC